MENPLPRLDMDTAEQMQLYLTPPEGASVAFSSRVDPLHQLLVSRLSTYKTYFGGLLAILNSCTCYIKNKTKQRTLPFRS